MKAEKPPRIGIPYRRASEEQAGNWEKIRPYVEAIEEAGGEANLISLFLPPEELARVAAELDGVVLPGSSADVDPALYGEAPGPETSPADRPRQLTDTALLDRAFQDNKPILAICYGTQMLNVYRGGSLLQDILSEKPSSLTHRWHRERGDPEPHHPARFVPGSQVARLAETVEMVVNSSHHQAIRLPGRGLRVTAQAPDGVVESVELEKPKHWVIGVQWHPERQRQEDPQRAATGIRMARSLFRELVSAARSRAETRGVGATAEAGSETE